MNAKLPLAVVLCSALCACPGTASGPDGSTPVDAGPVDAGVKVPAPVGFNARFNGWPAGQRAVGVGTMDGKVYAACESGVFALGYLANETDWVAQTVTLATTEKPTSLSRLDDALVLTVAGSGTGGVLVKRSGEDWARLDTAPAKAAWAMVRKGGSLLLMGAEGLSTAPTLAGPWTKKTTSSAAPFSRPVTHFAAAAAQTRLFFSGDVGGGYGGLYVSDDDGATWRSGLVRGDVVSLAAGAAGVLVETSTGGQQRSENYGGTFHAMAVGAPTATLAYLGGEFWAGTPTGLRRSTDLGATWSDDPNGLPADTAVVGLFEAGGIVLADSLGGPWLLALP